MKAPDYIRESPNGKISIFRIILIVCGLAFLYSMYIFHRFVNYEISTSEPINYTGLATILTAMVAEIVIPVLFKVIQKKYELKTQQDDIKSVGR